VVAEGDALVATKVTGDINVPAGQVRAAPVPGTLCAT
jgi:hypothetical protein